MCIKERIMNYVIAVFMSRSETLSFANMLKKINVPVAIVQTPRQAGKTCGISVKFHYENFSYAKDLLSRMRLNSFYGFLVEDDSFDSYKIVK